MKLAHANGKGEGDRSTCCKGVACGVGHNHAEVGDTKCVLVITVTSACTRVIAVGWCGGAPSATAVDAVFDAASRTDWATRDACRTKLKVGIGWNWIKNNHVA